MKTAKTGKTAKKRKAKETGRNKSVQIVSGAFPASKEEMQKTLEDINYGIRNSTYRKIQKVDEYGVRYEIYLSIIGRNGNVKSVKVCWILQGDKIKLTSAIPDDKQKAKTSKAYVPPIVDANLPANHRWQKIYDLAIHNSNVAMTKCIPTPMIVGQEIIKDGLCGGAYVHLHDARTRFAKWLKNKAFGDLGYKTGLNISIKSNTQSHYKEKCGAEAFAEVLILNGIDCDVEHYFT